jgi:hypothetical protein
MYLCFPKFKEVDMFFGPSKENLESAKVIDFYTKNIVGDLLISIMKSDRALLDKLFLSGNLNLKTWTTSAQLAAITFIFTTLSNSDLRGKQKLMELVAETINTNSEFTLKELMDCYSYINLQTLEIISDKSNNVNDRQEKYVLLVFGEMIVSRINGTTRRDFKQLLTDPTNVAEKINLAQQIVPRFSGYFK